MDPSAAQDQKAALRLAARARRDGLTPAEREAASERIVTRLAAELRQSDARLVAAYMPIGSEVDILPLFAVADELGVAMALPVQRDERLRFRAWHRGEALVTGPNGVREPADAAEEITPEIIIMPLIGFDRAGERLGYGRGHYDRTISALRDAGLAPRLVGAAFAVQEVEAIPAEAHDAALDAVVTEEEIIAFEHASKET